MKKIRIGKMAFLGFIFVLLPISILLFLLCIFTKKKIFGIGLLIMWGGLMSLFILSLILSPLWEKKILDKSDFYGNYVIDRNYFSGKQADWQYNHFRFEIKENDSIYFYVTEGEKVVKTFKGTISTVKPYKSARIKIKMEKPTHQILTTNPTIYREVWSFLLVFNSPKFYNMYFRKGTWKELE
ncbi:hypothetical protein ACG2LH_00925 [Zhouia sp. PK063]|uniref:hypothetical protein n=1 Tax=Zhouia sp. PK063 TaxID=3373602 RepID=UPI0037AD068B